MRSLVFLLPFLFRIQSMVYFVPTAYIPVDSNNGMSTVVTPCTAQQCADDDWCNYYSDQNDSYCWYGLARNYTAAAKSVGYVKYPNITECPGTTLSKTQVAALFGTPCQLSLANILYMNFNSSALIQTDNVSDTSNDTSFPYVTSVYNQAGYGFNVTLVQNFQEPQSSIYGCNRTHSKPSAASTVEVAPLIAIAIMGIFSIVSLPFVCYCIFSIDWIRKLQKNDLIPRDFLYKPIIFLCGYVIFDVLFHLPLVLYILYRHQLLSTIDPIYFLYSLSPFIFPILGVMGYHKLRKILGINRFEEELRDFARQFEAALQNQQIRQQPAVAA